MAAEGGVLNGSERELFMRVGPVCRGLEEERQEGKKKKRKKKKRSGSKKCSLDGNNLGLLGP